MVIVQKLDGYVFCDFFHFATAQFALLAFLTDMRETSKALAGDPARAGVLRPGPRWRRSRGPKFKIHTNVKVPPPFPRRRGGDDDEFRKLMQEEVKVVRSNENPQETIVHQTTTKRKITEWRQWRGTSKPFRASERNNSQIGLPSHEAQGTSYARCSFRSRF